MKQIYKVIFMYDLKFILESENITHVRWQWIILPSIKVIVSDCVYSLKPLGENKWKLK